MWIALTLVTLSLLLSGCGGPSVDISNVPELEPASADSLQELLSGSEQPVVVNVWASWCIPCRSEGPLLREAAESMTEDVLFVGLNVRDSQQGAREFIAEFLADAPFLHLLDSTGDIPSALGGSRGVPLTFFFAPGGELVTLHSGVIDERTLALQLDEILSR